MALAAGTAAVVGGEPCRVLEVDEDTGFALIERGGDQGSPSEWVLAAELEPAKDARPAKAKDEVSE